MRSKTDRMICGTCEFWTGSREPIFDTTGKPKIDIFDNTGLCENQRSRFIDQIRDKEKCCKSYSKWTEIL